MQAAILVPLKVNALIRIRKWLHREYIINIWIKNFLS